MLIINYTIMKNEKQEAIVVIDPINDNNNISYRRKADSLVIHNEKNEVAILFNLFAELKNTTTFLLVEFGTMGLIRETTINL